MKFQNVELTDFKIKDLPINKDIDISNIDSFVQSLENPSLLEYLNAFDSGLGIDVYISVGAYSDLVSNFEE